MANLNIERLVSLPAVGSLKPSTLYIIRNASNASLFDLYATGEQVDGQALEARHGLGPQDVQQAINEAIAGLDGNSLPDIPGSKIISEISVNTTGNAATATRAQSAASADTAGTAASADVAASLAPGATINGVVFTGETAIVVPAVDTETPRVPVSDIGVRVAPLVDGLVPTQFIPASFDNMEEHPTRSDFPAEGRKNVIYVSVDDNAMYRWSGTTYILIPTGGGGTDTALKLANARQIRLAGDATGEINNGVGFDGSADVTIDVTLKTLEGAAGTGSKVTVNEKGLVTEVAALTAGDVPDLPGTKIISALTVDTSGNAATADKLKTARTITFNGALNGTGTFDGSADVTITLAGGSTGVTPGEYTKVTVNAGGLVTAGDLLSVSDIPNLPGSKITSALTVDTSGKAATAGIADVAKAIELGASEW